MKDARKFIGDIAGTSNNRAFRQIFEVEDLIRGNPIFGARYRRDCRPGTGCDQYMLRADFTAIGKANKIWRGDRCPLEEYLHLVVAKCLSVQPFEPINLGGNIIAQCRPVECGAGRIPTKTAGIRQILCKMRTINQQFFGNAAADDAGSADAILFRHGNPCTMAGGDTRRTDAT